MITLAEYVGPYGDSVDWTLARRNNALKLLAACEKLQARMEADGVVFQTHSHTDNILHPRIDEVSGVTYGGFRPQDCPIGAPHSAHKEGQAVDIYDPKGQIDAWLLEFPLALVDFGLYIEHPDKTPGWSHWSTRRPGSGQHIFWP